jgi:hypothetical protein
MTAKEKAKELVYEFYQTTPNEAWINEPLGIAKVYKAYNQSKECALIAVDEILKEIYSNSVTTSDNRRLFWQEVREELVDKY